VRGEKRSGRRGALPRLKRRCGSGGGEAVLPRGQKSCFLSFRPLGKKKSGARKAGAAGKGAWRAWAGDAAKAGRKTPPGSAGKAPVPGYKQGKCPAKGTTGGPPAAGREAGSPRPGAGAWQESGAAAVARERDKQVREVQARRGRAKRSKKEKKGARQPGRSERAAVSGPQGGEGAAHARKKEPGREASGPVVRWPAPG